MGLRVPELDPLQIDTSTALLALVAVAFVIAFIAVIIFAVRRTRSIDDAYSKEAEAKLKAIKPPVAGMEETVEAKPSATTNTSKNIFLRKTPQLSEPAQTRAVIPPAPALRQTQRSGDASSQNLLTELETTKSQLQQQSRDLTGFKEREASMRNEVETLRMELQSLRGRVESATREEQKPTALPEQYIREFAALKEGEAVLEREKEALKTDVQALRERLETSMRDTQQLRASFEQQTRDYANLKHRETQQPDQVNSLRAEIRSLREQLDRSSQDSQKLKTSLDQYKLDLAVVKERESKTRNENESLKAEIPPLRERLERNAQEIQKLNASLEETKNKLQNHGRDIEQQTEKRMREVEERLRRAALTQPTPAQPSKAQLQPPPIPSPSTPAAAVIKPTPQLSALPSAQPSTATPPPAQAFKPTFWDNLLGRRRCTNCGRKLKSEDRFCDSCGQPIKK